MPQNRIVLKSIHYAFRGSKRTDWHAPTEPFGHTNDIWNYAIFLESKQRPCSPKTRLDFIENEEGAFVIAFRSKLMQEIERYAKQKQCLVMSLNIYRPDFRAETLEDVDPEEYRQCKSLSVKKRMKRVKRLISIYRAKGFKYQMDITEEDRMHSYGIQADLRYGDYDCMLDFHLCAYIGDGAEPPEDFKLKEYETLEELIETNPRESEYDSDRDSYEPEFEQDDPNYIFRHYPLGGLPEAPDGWDEIADSTYKYTGLVKEVDKDHCRKALVSETDLVSLLSVLPAYWNTNPFLDNVHDIKIRNEQEYIVAHDFLGNCYFAVFVDKDIELYFIHDRTLGLSLANDDFDAHWEEVLHKHQNQ